MGVLCQNSKNNVVNVTIYRKETTIMPFLFGLETVAIIGLKALFGKAVVGAAVKTGVGVAGKALLVHDAVRVIGHVADAATVVDAASTAADVADTASTVANAASTASTATSTAHAGGGIAAAAFGLAQHTVVATGTKTLVTEGGKALGMSDEDAALAGNLVAGAMAAKTAFDHIPNTPDDVDPATREWIRKRSLE